MVGGAVAHPTATSEPHLTVCDDLLRVARRELCGVCRVTGSSIACLFDRKNKKSNLDVGYQLEGTLGEQATL